MLTRIYDVVLGLYPVDPTLHFTRDIHSTEMQPWYLGLWQKVLWSNATGIGLNWYENDIQIYI